MAQMSQEQARKRNWRIRNPRSLWALCNAGWLDEDLSKDAREAIDAQLRGLGAEPQGVRRGRLLEQEVL